MALQAHPVQRVRAVWHPALTTAAELGGTANLQAARAARAVRVGSEFHVLGLHGWFFYPDGQAAAPAGSSPFDPRWPFGILALAVWHGRQDAVAALLEMGYDPHRKAQVPTKPYSVDWAVQALQLPEQAVGWPVVGGQADGVLVTPMQIAFYKRDATAVRLLQQAGVQLAADHSDFLLDFIQPTPGSLFATKAGRWSTAFHRFMPPAFKAATIELLRISRKHGGDSDSRGRTVWPFTPALLEELLLPLLAADVAAMFNVPSQVSWATTRVQTAALEASHVATDT